MHDGAINPNGVADAIRAQQEIRTRQEVEDELRLEYEDRIRNLQRQVSAAEAKWNAAQVGSVDAAFLRSENRDLTERLRQARHELESSKRAYEELLSKRRANAATGKTTKAGKPMNRVIYWCTARLNADAAEMRDLLWKERPKFNDGPEQGMKIPGISAEGDTLKFAVDYTVRGGVPQDIERMMDKTAKRIGNGLAVLDLECIEKSREVLPDPKTATDEDAPVQDDDGESSGDDLTDPDQPAVVQPATTIRDDQMTI